MKKVRAISHLRAANIGYFFCGLCVACYAPLIPIIQDELQLNNFAIGSLVFAFGLGSICGLTFSGTLSNKYGFRNIYIVSCFMCACFSLGLSLIPSLYLLLPIVYLLGFSIGFLEVLINIYGAALERHYKIFFLSPLFAYYSLGEVIGSCYMLTCLSYNLTPSFAVFPIIILIYLGTLFYSKKVLNISSESEKKSAFMWPRGAILPLSFIVCATFIVGGATIDWSALFIKEELNLDSKYTAFGYALVSFCMLICRLSSKKIVKRLGMYKTVLGGSSLMILGLILVLCISNIYVYIVGFILIGVGMSNISPLSMSAVAKQKDMPLVAAISTISTIGYAGLMFAPACLGIIAGLFNVYSIYLTLLALTICSFITIRLSAKIYKNTRVALSNNLN